MINPRVALMYPASPKYPPEITILAVPSSGLSDLISSFLTNFVKVNSSAPSPLIISAVPPSEGAASNEVGLIVTHFFLSLLLTVAKAFPAYIGLKNVSGETTLIISLFM